MNFEEKVGLIENGFSGLIEALQELSREIWQGIDPTDIAMVTQAAVFQKQFLEANKEFGELTHQITRLLKGRPGTSPPAVDPVSIQPSPPRRAQKGYPLAYDFTHCRPSAVTIEGVTLEGLHTWRDLEQTVCNFCGNRNPALFTTLPDHPGFMTSHGGRTFARNPEALRNALPLDHGLFVECNIGSKAIIAVLRALLQLFGIRERDVKIFLRDGTVQTVQENHKNRKENGDEDHLVPSEFRHTCLTRIEQRIGTALTRVSATLFTSPDSKTLVMISVSKLYTKEKTTRFWYTLTASQIDSIKESPNGLMAFGCGSPENLLLIPYRDAEAWLNQILVVDDDGDARWDIKLGTSEDGYPLLPPYTGPARSLQVYQI